eukprot:m.119394 g.119394  ORF g.119394 m.119394 type:complete len:515 (-) comp15588_c0_seq6:182-1726(-)
MPTHEVLVSASHKQWLPTANAGSSIRVTKYKTGGRTCRTVTDKVYSYLVRNLGRRHAHQRTIYFIMILAIGSALETVNVISITPEKQILLRRFEMDATSTTNGTADTNDTAGALGKVINSVTDSLSKNANANAFGIASALLGILITLMTNASSVCLSPEERRDTIYVIFGLVGGVDVISTLTEDIFGVTVSGTLSKLRFWNSVTEENLGAHLKGISDEQARVHWPQYGRVIVILFILFKAASNFFIAALPVLFAAIEDETILKRGCNNQTYDITDTPAGDRALQIQDDLRDLMVPFFWAAAVTTLVRIVLDIAYERLRDKKIKEQQVLGYNLVTYALGKAVKAVDEPATATKDVYEYCLEQTRRLAVGAALLVGAAQDVRRNDPLASNAVNTTTGAHAHLLLEAARIVDQAKTDADLNNRIPADAILIDLEDDALARQLATDPRAKPSPEEQKLLLEATRAAHKQALKLLRGKVKGGLKASDVISVAQAFLVMTWRNSSVHVLPDPTEVTVARV